MFGSRVKIDPDLFQAVKKCAEKAGYASAEEFVHHVLEKEVARILGSGGSGESPDSDEEVKKRLQGLGYIE